MYAVASQSWKRPPDPLSSRPLTSLWALIRLFFHLIHLALSVFIYLLLNLNLGWAGAGRVASLMREHIVNNIFGFRDLVGLVGLMSLRVPYTRLSPD